MAKKKKGSQTKALPVSVTTFELTGDDNQAVYYTQYDEQRNTIALKGDGVTVESDLPNIEQYIGDEGLLRIPKDHESGEFTVKTVIKDVQYEGDITIGSVETEEEIDDSEEDQPDTGVPEEEGDDAAGPEDDDDDDPAYRQLPDDEESDDAENPASEDDANDEELPERIDSTEKSSGNDAKFTHVDESGFYNQGEADTSNDAPVQPDPEESEDDVQPSVIPGGSTDDSGVILDDTTVTYTIETHGVERGVEGELDDLAAAMFDDLRSNQNSSLLRDGQRIAMMRRVATNGQHVVDVLYFASESLPELESDRIIKALRGYENRLVVGAKPIQ